MTNSAITLIETYLDGTSCEEELRLIKNLLKEDWNFRQQFIDACRFNGMLKSASHSDSHCVDLIKLLDIATGNTDTISFEDSIINSIETKVKIKEFSEKPVKIITGKKRYNSGRKNQRNLRHRKKKVATQNRSLIWASIAAVLAIAGGLFLTVMSNNSETALIANVTLMKGDGKIIRNGEALNASQVTKLYPGDVYRGSSESSFKVNYLDGTEVSVLNKSLASFILSKNGGKKIEMDEGLLKADVSKQPVGKPFEILTPKAQATVLGTIFTIKAEDNYTEMTVTEGLVRFKRLSDNLAYDVPANHKISTESNPFKAESLRAINKAVAEKGSALKISLIYNSKGDLVPEYKDMKNGMIIDGYKVPSKMVNFVFEPSPVKYESFEIKLEGTMIRTKGSKLEESATFSVFGDSFTHPLERTAVADRGFYLEELRNGKQIITITPVLNGVKQKPYVLNFTVINSNR